MWITALTEQEALDNNPPAAILCKPKMDALGKQVAA